MLLLAQTAAATAPDTNVAPFITSDAGVLAVLTGVCAFFFALEKRTQWRLFQYLPPLVFIYLMPVILSNTDVIPRSAPAYDVISKYGLPMMLVLMLLNVDVLRTIELAGRGVGVMLFGALGVVVGATAGYALVHRWLEPEAWKGYAALTGSWVGGTGNLIAVSEALQSENADVAKAQSVFRALAVLADTTWLLFWLPVMLTSKKWAPQFARFAKVDPERVRLMDEAAVNRQTQSRPADYRDYLTLLFAAFLVTSAVDALAPWLKEKGVIEDLRMWRILLITTLGIALSFTPLRRVPGSQQLGMALIFLFMAQTGASADLAGVAEQALPFLGGALVCLLIHGLFCLLGAKLLHVDIHTAAIASAANVGGVATASCVAAHHKETLMSAAILLALLGYALGNYCGLLTAALCRLVS